jgi:hypothetical protein
VQIVEDQEGGPARGELVEKAGDGVEQAKACLR